VFAEAVVRLKPGLLPVDLEAVGTISLQDDRGQAVPGTTTLRGARRLEFLPAQRLQACMVYAATLSGGRTKCGLDGNLSWKFTTWLPASVDPTFGQAGGALAPGLGTEPLGLAVLTGGDLLADYNELVLLDAAGEPDPAFGTGGQLHYFQVGVPYELRGFAVDDAGRILLVTPPPLGDVQGGWAMYRLAGRGALDPTYGIGGMARVVRATRTLWSTREMLLRPLPDGVLLVGFNEANQAGGPAGRVVRLRADGLPDPGFGSAGTVSMDGALVGLETTPDGRVMMLSSEASCAARLERLDASGASDVAFGSAGSMCMAGMDTAQALRVDSQGRLLVAGMANGGSTRTLRRLAVSSDGRAAVGGHSPFTISFLGSAGALEHQETAPSNLDPTLAAGDRALAFDVAHRLHVALRLEAGGAIGSWRPVVVRFQ
jgi:hypothetical protein